MAETGAGVEENYFIRFVVFVGFPVEGHPPVQHNVEGLRFFLVGGDDVFGFEFGEAHFFAGGVDGGEVVEFFDGFDLGRGGGTWMRILMRVSRSEMVLFSGETMRISKMTLRSFSLTES